METNLIHFLFLVPLAIIGIICSYTDIKYKKIFNKWIVWSFIYIIFLYCFLFLFLKDNIYIFSLILNGLIAFSIGYILWYFRLWSAGDAKLFTVYSFLIPLFFYSENFIPYFPSFNLLINLFIPVLVVLIISALFFFLKEIFGFREKIRKIKYPGFGKIFIFFKQFFHYFLNYVFIFIILNSIIFPLTRSFKFSDVLDNPFFIFALLILTIGSFTKKRQENKKLNWVLYGIILNFYVEKKEIEKIKAKDIKKGMIPAEREEILFLTKNNDDFGKISAEGLSENQVKIIKNFLKNNESSEITIYKTFPFAPFLFLSAIISILTQSSFLPIIDSLIGYFI